MAENQPEQSQKQRLKEITDSIEAGIQELFVSNKYTQYLRTMSRFHKYSLNNTLLISMQNPNATAVAGFNKWKDQFSRNVKKGEKGIKIIAPTPYKVKEQREKIDPFTKAPMLDSNGKVQTEEVEKQIPMFRVISVFDVSQTEGKALPSLASNLTGNVEQFEIFIEALKRSAPVPIAFERMNSDTDGYYQSTDKRIAIREGMSEVQTISAIVHEIAHSKLHDREQEKQEQAQTDEKAPSIPKKDRATEEVEAESISFAVCNYYGIQTAENSLGYIATWSKGKELKELKSSLETINKTSSKLITDIDHHFAEIVKKRDIDLTAAVSEPSEVDILATSIHDFIIDYKRDDVDIKRITTGEIKENLIQGKTEVLKDFIIFVGDKIDDKKKEAQEMVMLIDEYGDKNYPTELAYQIEDTYFSIQTIEDGYDYSIYDKDYNLIDGVVYDNSDITIYEAIHYTLEQDKGFALWDKNGTTKVDYEELTEKADNVAMSKIVGSIKYSDVTSELVQSAPTFKDEDMPLYTNIDGDKYVLGYGSAMTSNTVVWNYLEEVDNDYRTIARINTLGHIHYKDDKIPDTAIAAIEKQADYIRSQVKAIPITDNVQITDKSDGIEVLGHNGTWYVEDTNVIEGTKYFLLEHEEHGDMTPCVIVDSDGTLVIDEVSNGFADLKEHLADTSALTEQQQEVVANIGGNVVIAHTVGAGKAPHTDYPMPDPTVSIADCNEFGYTAEELLPLSKDRAKELFNEDLTIYALHTDNTEAMIFDIEEIDSHAGYLGIEKVDWEGYFEFKEMQNQEWSLPIEKEQGFMEAQTDSFAIYQLKSGEDYRDYRFEDLDRMTARGLLVNRENYNLIYTDELQNCSTTDKALNALYHDFNQDKPDDYRGRSLSVSDIVALKMEGVVSSHYVDSFGFKEVTEFVPPSNQLETLKESTLIGRIDYLSPRGEVAETDGYFDEQEFIAKVKDNNQYGVAMSLTFYRNESGDTISKEWINDLDHPLQGLHTADLPIENPTVIQLEQDVKDGKTISLLDLSNAVNTERKPKKSVIDQLKPIPQDHKKEKTAPSKGAEMER